MIRAGSRHDLSQIKQEMNKTLRSYTWRFFKMRATIANTTDEYVIHYFQNALFSKHTYHYFGRNLDYYRGTPQQWHGGPTRRMRRTSASPSATMTSRATTTTTPTKVSGTTWETPENASETMKSWMLSTIHGARSQGTIKLSSRKSCTSDARCTQIQNIRSSSA
jgi:hypothetical protein